MKLSLLSRRSNNMSTPSCNSKTKHFLYVIYVIFCIYSILHLSKYDIYHTDSLSKCLCFSGLYRECKCTYISIYNDLCIHPHDSFQKGFSDFVLYVNEDVDILNTTHFEESSKRHMHIFLVMYSEQQDTLYIDTYQGIAVQYCLYMDEDCLNIFYNDNNNYLNIGNVQLVYV